MRRSPIGFFNGNYYKEPDFNDVIYEDKIFLSRKELDECLIEKDENGKCLIMYEGKERRGEIICLSEYANKYIIGIRR